MVFRSFLIVYVLIFASSCGVLKKQITAESEMIALSSQPMPPEKTKALLKDVSQNWLYGDGVGQSLFNIGAMVAFPPYAVALLGNTIISASGYQPLGVSYLLNKEQKPSWDKLYSDIFSGPGRLISAISGKEYRTPEDVKQRLLHTMRASLLESQPRNF